MAADICNYAFQDGYCFATLSIYREQIKNHNNLYMANFEALENPCEVISEGIMKGLVYLAVKTIVRRIYVQRKKMGRPCQQGHLHYLYGERVPGYGEGSTGGICLYFPRHGASELYRAMGY